MSLQNHLLTLFLLAFLPFQAFAQGSFDQCSNAYEFPIPDNGFGYGTFSSPLIDLTNATWALDERSHPLQVFNGTNHKSVWLKFSTATTRSVTLTLRQHDSAIAQNAVGFTIYSGSQCHPTPDEIAQDLPALTKFGFTATTCLPAGDYLVQVSANQRAQDSIWVELDLAPPVADYDQAQTAYDFGKVTTKTSQRFRFYCTSVDSTPEVEFYQGKEFRHSVWARFSAPKDAMFFLMETSPSEPDILYRLFLEENGLPSSLLDSGTFAGPSAYSPSDIPMGDSLILQLLGSNRFHDIRLYFATIQGDTTRSANPRHLDSTYHLQFTSQWSLTSAEDTWNRNAYLKSYCHPGPEDSVVLAIDSARGDTHSFNLSAWITIEVPDTGNIIPQIELGPCGSWPTPSSSPPTPVLFRIYKGDIRTNCQLPLIGEVYSDNPFCLPESGTYSLQILTADHPPSSQHLRDFCNQSMLGQRFQVDVEYYEKESAPVTRHHSPPLSENLGDIAARLANGPVSSSIDHFGSFPDPVRGYSYNKVDYIYREFYVSRRMGLTIFDGGSGVNEKLFRGRASDSSATYRFPDSLEYIDIEGNPEICKLDTGWYTIVSKAYYLCYPIRATLSQIHIHPIQTCQHQFATPAQAGLVNQGQPLTWGPNSNSPDVPVFAREYQLPPACYPCPEPASSIDPKSCYYLYDTLKANTLFYTFTLSQEAFVKIRAASRSALFFGDARSNPALVNDPNARIADCGASSTYCRLQPGSYTLQFLQTWRRSVPQKTLDASIYIDRILPQTNDHAALAEDLGTLPAAGSWAASPLQAFSCQQSAHLSDPDVKEHFGFRPNYSAFPEDGSFNPTSPSVPIPLPPNTPISEERWRNLWFTFTSTGSGTIELKLDSLSPNADGKKPTLWVFRSDEDGSLSFSQLQQQRKVDSTHDDGLTPVPLQMDRFDPDQPMYFEKVGCGATRYFVVVANERGSLTPTFTNSFYLRVRHNSQPLPLVGDHCSDAISAALMGTGTATATAKIHCHTLGGDYGEDGSNMTCLTYPDSAAQKSTWFRFSYTGQDTADIQFAVRNLSSAANSRIRYRVFYGSCRALTPATCVSGITSSFRLDCLGPGDYFLQVVSPEMAAGEIEATMTATPAAFPKCKPLSTLQPLAHFTSFGGCNGDSVTLRNYSTAGADIQYFWDFGNGQTSTETSPTVWLPATQMPDTYHVELVVVNTAAGKADSVTLPVYVYGQPVTLTVSPQDTTIYCNNPVQLKAIINVPNALYDWLPQSGLDSPYSATPVSLWGDTVTYSVTATIGSCMLKGKSKLNIIRGIPPLPDLFACTDTFFVLHGPEGFNDHNWGHSATGEHHHSQDSVIISTPGKWHLSTYSNVCWVKDSFTIYSPKEHPLDITTEVPGCIGDAVTLCVDTFFQNVQWSSGQSSHCFTTSTSGLYSVTANLGPCPPDSAQQSVSLTPHPWTLGADTSICPDDSLTLQAPTHLFDRSAWNDGSQQPTLTVAEPGLYWLSGWRNQCQQWDTIRVSRWPDLSIPDSIYDLCSTTEVTIDGGAAANYYWITSRDTGRFLTVTDEGEYPVEITSQYECTYWDTAVVTEHCPPVLYVPNAFSPNTDEHNPVFRAEGDHVYELKLSIYNRWGELIFVSASMEKGWNGTHNGNPAPVGVYLWEIEYTGYQFTGRRSGSVTLIR